MEETKALICAVVALSLIHVVVAADYVVGSPAGGWERRTDYNSWAAAQTFAPGDTLTFKYNSYHNVLEVTKDAFDACVTTNPISYDNSGSTTFQLTMPGRRYFICGAPGHCLAGMKMEVAVADRPAPTTPSPPPLLTPPGHAKRRPAPAPMPLTPAPRSWAPAPAPAAAPPSRAGHKKHTKRHCPPKAAPARAPTPTVQSVEAEFPLADFAPMSSAPPPPMSSAGPVVPRAKWGKVTVVLGALVLLAL